MAKDIKINQSQIVHIFGQSPHHYVPMHSFFEKLTKTDSYSQVYWAWLHPEQTEKDNFVYYSNSKQLIERMGEQPKSSRFVFHGFFDRSLWPKLTFSKLSKRCSWVCWGDDIYQHKALERGFKLRVMHYLHGVLSRRFFANYALNEGDAELIKSMLKTKNVEVLPYPLIGSKAVRDVKPVKQPIVILVGNSASPNNEHIQAFTWLSQYAAEDIRVVVPLNYAGTKEYTDKVLAQGNKLFGAKFEPVTKMLDKGEYDQLLANTDVVVFAHKRQQGLYVVYSALKQGQKMYMRSDISSFSSLQKFGFFVSASEKIAGLNFSDFIHISDEKTATNRQLMLATYSEDALLPRWDNMLKELLKS